MPDRATLNALRLGRQPSSDPCRFGAVPGEMNMRPLPHRASATARHSKRRPAAAGAVAERRLRAKAVPACGTRAGRARRG